MDHHLAKTVTLAMVEGNQPHHTGDLTYMTSDDVLVRPWSGPVWLPTSTNRQNGKWWNKN